jgi:hypothetical protein
VKVAAVIVAGAISSVKAATITVLVATPLTALSGLTAVTCGAIAATTPPPAAPKPRIGSRPAPHPAAKVLSSRAMSQVARLEQLANLITLLSS